MRILTLEDTWNTYYVRGMPQEHVFRKDGSGPQQYSSGPWAPAETSPPGCSLGICLFLRTAEFRLPSVLMPAGPCQLPREWLPNFNDSRFPTASKRSATGLAARDVQTHRCQDKGWPRQSLPAARASQRAPTTWCLRNVSFLLRRWKRSWLSAFPGRQEASSSIEPLLGPGSPASGSQVT